MIFDRLSGSRLGRALPSLLCGFATVLCGCHGNDIVLPGTPVLTMGGLNRIANPDFASYIVLVDSITLTRNDGAVVQPLSTPETVDLAKLDTFGELVEAPAVPDGTYLSAAVTIDYSAASIYANESGRAVLVSPVTPSGVAMSAATVTVTFDPKNPLVITASQSDRVALDVDLSASNTINTSAGTVTVQPFLVMSPLPADTSVMRVRGSLVLAQPPNDYIINARPFYDLSSALGAIQVNVNENTYYTVNGTVYSGSAGLSALQALQQVSPPVAAYGTLDNLSTITPTFNATEVYAGTSLESEIADYFLGTVSTRNGNTLTLRGTTYQTPLGLTYYYGATTVTIDDTTTVTEDGVLGKFSIGSISSGQQITAVGTASVTSAGALTLDAVGGLVRVAPTQLIGTLNSATGTSASVNMVSLANWAPEGFDFLGAASSGQTITPSAYQVATGSTNLGSVAAGTVLAAQGFAAPYGSAPPDFFASSIGAAPQQQMVVEWDGSVTQPFTSVADAGLVVDLHNSAITSIHYIRSGASTVDMTTLPASPLISTAGAPQSELLFAVGSDAVPTVGISVFNTFIPFATQVLHTFPATGNTNAIYRLVAYGQYNSTTNTFVASRIYIALNESST